MSDLVERLRAWHTPNETITGDVQFYLDAAARIEALEAALRVIIKVKGADPWIDVEAIQAIARTALAGGQDT